MAIGKNCRIEPDNETSIELDSQFLKGFEKAGWLEIIMKFFCYSIEVTIAFSTCLMETRLWLGVYSGRLMKNSSLFPWVYQMRVRNGSSTHP